MYALCLQLGHHGISSTVPTNKCVNNGLYHTRYEGHGLVSPFLLVFRKAESVAIVKCRIKINKAHECIHDVVLQVLYHPARERFDIPFTRSRPLAILISQFVCVVAAWRWRIISQFNLNLVIRRRLPQFLSFNRMQMALTTLQLQEWVSDNHADHRKLAEAWNIADKDSLLAKLVKDSHLRAIEKELADGLSEVYDKEITPNKESKHTPVTRKRLPLSVGHLLADPDWYDELLGPYRQLPLRRNYLVGRAILRMILSLDYPAFESREVELDTVLAAKCYIGIWSSVHVGDGHQWAVNWYYYCSKHC